MIVYEGHDEVFVMADTQEAKFLKLYFAFGSGRDLSDFEREVADFVSIKQNHLQVDME